MLAASHPAGAQAGSSRAVRGTVYDSLSSRPLPGAQVALLDRGNPSAPPRSTTTDSAGHFGFEDVAPGTYVVGFEALVLDSLGIASPTRLLRIGSESPSIVEVGLAVPSGRAVHDAFCPQREATDSTSALVGHLTDASTRGVVSGGTVQASWIDVTKRTHDVAVNRITSEAESGSDGWFAICDLPTGMPVEIVAMAGADTSAVVNLVVPESRGLLRQELYLGNRTAPHTGTVEGLVKDETTNRPIPGARVAADGASATSGADGRFSLLNLPYGTILLTSSARGYQTAQQRADVLAGGSPSLTIPLLSNAMMSDTARETAAAAIATKHGFDARKRTLDGVFFSFKDLRRQTATRTSDVMLRAFNTLQSVDTGSVHGFAVMYGRKQVRCAIMFYVDGVLARDIHSAVDLDADVPLGSLAAIELYGGLAPAEFPGSAHDAALSETRSCGTVVMWRLPRPLWADWDRH